MNIFTHANIILNICTRISKLQKKVIRFLTKCKFNSHTAPLFKQLGLLKAVDIFKLACFNLLYKYENRKLPSYFNGMFVLQHDNVVIRPRRIHRTPQRFNITEEILPYNNVCNFKIKHTNSKFCRLCIINIYKIPELIKDNYFPKIVLILLVNIKQHVKFEIATYAKNHQYSCLSNFLLESIEPHASFVYIGSFSVVHHGMYYEIVINITCNMIALFSL